MGNEKIKVLIGDNCSEESLKTASELCNTGIYAYTRKKDGNVIFDSIVNDMPDVVIADLSLPNMDMIKIIKESEKKLVKCPAFIVISDINNTFIERQIIDSGASYYLPRPFETGLICSIVKSVVKRIVTKDSTDTEIIVTDIIQQFGIPANIKGYHYLRSAVIFAVNDRSLMDCITKMLYPKVAEKYQTTSSRVERAIRHAIETAWNSCDENTFSSLLGYTFLKKREKPTNSELIALIADRLILQLKKNGAVQQKNFYEL